MRNRPRLTIEVGIIAYVVCEGNQVQVHICREESHKVNTYLGCWDEECKERWVCMRLNDQLISTPEEGAYGKNSNLPKPTETQLQASGYID